jgi:3-keto-disaccharide hydrolase
MISRSTFPWIALALAFSSAAQAQSLHFDFDRDVPGGLPGGWESGVTGKGTSRWEVVRDASAPSQPNALRQSGVGTFVWAVVRDASYAAGAIEVRFKTLSGQADQAAGIVWRFQDAQNYYVVRANALEDNVVAYKVVSGKRTDLKPRGAGILAYGVSAAIRKKQWNTLAVEFTGRLFSVSLNGEKLFSVEDDTFSAPGSIGLWTKADSVTLFDDFRFTPR